MFISYVCYFVLLPYLIPTKTEYAFIQNDMVNMNVYGQPDEFVEDLYTQPLFLLLPISHIIFTKGKLRNDHKYLMYFSSQFFSAYQELLVGSWNECPTVIY